MASEYRNVALNGTNYCIDVLGILKPANARGKDSILPGQEGRYARNRQKDYWRVTLEGWVRGLGSTTQAKQQSFFSTMQTIMATMDESLTPGDLVLEGPDYGLPTGETWTLSARCINVVLGPMRNSWAFQEFSAELEAVADWDIEPS